MTLAWEWCETQVCGGTSETTGLGQSCDHPFSHVLMVITRLRSQSHCSFLPHLLGLLREKQIPHSALSIPQQCLQSVPPQDSDVTQSLSIKEITFFLISLPRPLLHMQVLESSCSWTLLQPKTAGQQWQWGWVVLWHVVFSRHNISSATADFLETKLNNVTAINISSLFFFKQSHWKCGWIWGHCVCSFHKIWCWHGY